MTTFITTILLVFGNLFLEPGEENAPSVEEPQETSTETSNSTGKKIGDSDLIF
jgi:hypothetical protein